MVLRLTHGPNRGGSLTTADGHLTSATGLRDYKFRSDLILENVGRTLDETAAATGSQAKGPGIPKGSGLSAETPRGATVGSVRNSA